MNTQNGSVLSDAIGLAVGCGIFVLVACIALIVTAHRKYKGTKTVKGVIVATAAFAGYFVTVVSIGVIIDYGKFIAQGHVKSLTLLAFFLGAISVVLASRIMGITWQELAVFGASHNVLRADEKPKARLCPQSYWSLILFLVPYIGLLMAIVALFRIRNSNGALRGTTLAWIGFAVNLSILALAGLAIANS